MSATAFQNIYEKDVLGFFKDNNLHAKQVTEFLGLTNEDVSKIARVEKVSVRYDEKIPKAVEERLKEIANICNLVVEHFDGDIAKTQLWFSTSNPMFGNISARDMIRFGRYQKLLKFVLSAKEVPGETGAS